MKLIDKHILKELIGPFFFGVAAFTSIMFAGKELFKITELIAEYGAPPMIAIKLIVLFLPSIVVMTLPMSMLLCALLGFGRLSGESEVIALFASGISLYRIALPVVVMAMVVTGAGFVLSEVVAPQANVEHDRIFQEFD
ncbi:MAG: LptF/LptG family permease, partial [Armatimonadota bacterium]